MAKLIIVIIKKKIKLVEGHINEVGWFLKFKDEIIQNIYL